MIERVISGGQGGADLAGLEAAKSAGIPTGGTAPKGWRVLLTDGSEGSNPELKDFGLVEHSSREWRDRTIANVTNSCGTVWVGDSKSPGGRLTINTCLRQHKPLIINPTAIELYHWTQHQSIKVLNVAGNRASNKNPDIYQKTYDLILAALKLMQEGQNG